MNCPSRTDEDPVHPHPDWNQNPPFLTADLTKREDLNGRVNERQWRIRSGLLASSDDCTNLSIELQETSMETHPIPKTRPLADAKFPRCYREEFCSAASQAPSLICYITSGIQIFKRWFIHHQSYFWWIVVNALVTATTVHYMGNNFPKESRQLTTTTTPPRVKRASTCENGGANSTKYNTPLHVGALFIILFLSFFACAFPLLVVRFPRLRIPASFLFVVRHFGTGVLIATAFVHLLPTAFTSLGNPCLSTFWTKDYTAMPGAIALAAVFLVTIVEMVFSPCRHLSGGVWEMHNNLYDNELSPETPERSNGASIELTDRNSNLQNFPSDVDRDYGCPKHDSMCERSSNVERGLDPITASSQPDRPTEMLEGTNAEHNTSHLKGNEGGQANNEITSLDLNPEQKRQKAIMQCVLLEVGILFHSVFIGMALSVSIGKDFVILLIAIGFHQSFEGLALGSRIASLSWDPKATQPWLMALAYGCTTPLGQAIGLATHSLYSPDSEVGLIMVGTMNAISSGLLVYASLVELLSEDFLSDESWRYLRGKRRVVACILVFAGAFGMSLVGAWA